MLLDFIFFFIRFRVISSIEMLAKLISINIKSYFLWGPLRPALPPHIHINIHIYVLLLSFTIKTHVRAYTCSYILIIILISIEYDILFTSPFVYSSSSLLAPLRPPPLETLFLPLFCLHSTDLSNSNLFFFLSVHVHIHVIIYVRYSRCIV